jgi:predicted metal-dependent hydrolase
MLEIAGIPVAVRRKRVKHLHLYVKPPDGHVLVTAPLLMSDADIARFVSSKSDWLQKHVAKFALRPAPVTMQYQTGETLWVFGKPYRLLAQHGGRYGLTLTGDTAILNARAASTAAQREKYVNEWKRAMLTAEIARRLPAWETVTNLRASGFQIKRMSTRWGTCNIKTGKLWFSLHLAEKPPECLDYILLHELLHLKERGHNKRFYGLLDFYMPGWKERKTALK